ncbi:phage major capsid protein, HK97 family [Nitrosospira sp. Nl5]|uniref:phage major capsid protein n=1 Tax=Nitrosospira sp. Nl5 TaxID=200120 RepID=UPI0008918AC3|nr:phage major capsid protein [Nitrosospira sp. Nl5]SCX93927.1 phage major capsid protein, HK97 family [Nitrosospira sp. Nl5]
MNIQALREKIANLATQAKHILAEKGDQTWTSEDQAKFDNLANEIELTKSQIKAEERLRELDADKFFENTSKDIGKRGEDEIDALTAVALYMRHGSDVTPEQAVAIRNAMSTTTTTEGGYTVPSEVAAMVIDKLKAFGGMREVASILTTETGVNMNWPTSDGTADVGAIVGQNTAVNAADITFGTIGLNPFYYTSNKIALPLELIQDSAIDVVAYVVDRLATRIARIQNTHFTTGAGTTLPDGVIPKSSTGKTGTTGQTLTVIYDDLVDLKHSVNRAYRKNARFMMNDLSVAVVSKLKDTTGRPIWVPSVVVDAPDTLLGFPVAINDDVAVMAANAKSIAFGDLSKYTIRDIANTTVLRRFDDSAFALSNQVGFCGWTRSGGNLLDTAAVKLYVNSAT